MQLYKNTHLLQTILIKIHIISELLELNVVIEQLSESQWA